MECLTDLLAALLVVSMQLLNEQNFQYGRWQHIVNFTFIFHWYQYDLLSWKYEAN